jgi:hypothetical protein
MLRKKDEQSRMHIYIYNGGRDSNMDFALAEYAMDTSYFSVPRLLVDLARHVRHELARARSRRQ